MIYVYLKCHEAHLRHSYSCRHLLRNRNASTVRIQIKSRSLDGYVCCFVDKGPHLLVAFENTRIYILSIIFETKRLVIYITNETIALRYPCFWEQIDKEITSSALPVIISVRTSQTNIFLCRSRQPLVHRSRTLFQPRRAYGKP